MWSDVRLLALGLWLGAMLAFAFLFAPIAFAHIGPTPAFAATIAAALAGLTRAGDWCGIIAAGITSFVALDRRRNAAAIVACIAIAIALGLIETQALIPQMQTTPLQTPAYQALHQTSSSIYAAILLLIIGAYVLAARSRTQAA